VDAFAGAAFFERCQADCMPVRFDELATTRDVIVDARLRPTEWFIPEARRCNAAAA
jgi:hypothetical protein